MSKTIYTYNTSIDKIAAAIRENNGKPVKLVPQMINASITAYPAFGDFELELETPSPDGSFGSEKWILEAIVNTERTIEIFCAYNHYHSNSDWKRIFYLTKWIKGSAMLNPTSQLVPLKPITLPPEYLKAEDLKLRLQNEEPINNLGKTAISIDFKNGVLKFDYGTVSALNDVSDIVYCGIEVNDVKSTETSNSSAIGRAVVAGVLTGGIGALIGGFTAKQEQVVNVNSVSLVLTFIDKPSSIIKIDLYRSGAFWNKHTPQSAQDKANAIKSWIERMQSQKTQSDQVNITVSLSDQILNLAQLHSQGLLTSDEFIAAKRKLLSV